MSQRRSSPHRLFSLAEDALRQSSDVIEDDFTSTPDSRIWDLSPMPLGAAQRRPGNRRNRRLNQRQFVELYLRAGRNLSSSRERYIRRSALSDKSKSQSVRQLEHERELQPFHGTAAHCNSSGWILRRIPDIPSLFALERIQFSKVTISSLD